MPALASVCRCRMPSVSSQREGEVLAAVSGSYSRVTNGKIAHVQFVDHGVGGRLHALRRLRAVPVRRFQARGLQVRDVTATGIGRQADGVGIRHAVAHEADSVDLHVDEVSVVVAGEIAIDDRGPDAGLRVALQLLQRMRRPVAVVVQAQRHVACGRGPQRERRPILRDRHAELRVGGVRVQVVERPWRLQSCRTHHPAVCVFLDEQQLLLMEPAQGVGVRLDPQRDACCDVTKASRDGRRQVALMGWQIERAVGTVDRQARYRNGPTAG